jgi:hypothetical protein
VWIGAVALAAALAAACSYQRLGGDSKVEPTKVVVLGGGSGPRTGASPAGQRSKRRRPATPRRATRPRRRPDRRARDGGRTPAARPAQQTEGGRDPTAARPPPGRIRTCFNQNGDRVGTPELALSLDRSGGHGADADLVPAELSTELRPVPDRPPAASPSTQDDGVKVTIPLKVRPRRA